MVGGFRDDLGGDDVLIRMYKEGIRTMFEEMDEAIRLEPD